MAISTYTKKKGQTVVEIFKELGTVTDACKALNINRLTYYNWLRDIPEFRELIERTKEEIAEDLKHKAIKAIKENFSKNWTSAAWWLERAHPDEYAKREKLDTNMTISQVKIKYVLPEHDENLELPEAPIIKLEPPKNDSE